MDDQQALQSMMDKIDAEEAAEAATAEQTPVQEGAPETASAAPEVESQAEPEAPAIEPPSTWKSEFKDDWTKLPRDLQQKLAQWETERNQGVNAKLNESAEEKKAAAQERQRYASQLDSLISQATALDPVLSIANRMTAADWTKLWTENPGQAGALEAQVRERQGTINAWGQQRQALVQQQMQAMETQEAAKLAEKLPEWKDESKRGQFTESLRKVAQEHYGFRKEELANVLDHRHVLALADAAKWQNHLAAQKAAQDKKVATTPQRVMKPSSTNQAPTSDRVKALKQRAIRTGKDDDVLAALMAAQT